MGKAATAFSAVRLVGPRVLCYERDFDRLGSAVYTAFIIFLCFDGTGDHVGGKPVLRIVQESAPLRGDEEERHGTVDSSEIGCSVLSGEAGQKIEMFRMQEEGPQAGGLPREETQAGSEAEVKLAQMWRNLANGKVFVLQRPCCESAGEETNTVVYRLWS